VARQQVDIHNELPKITAPTLVLQAVGDRSTTFDNAVTVSSRIPGARLVSLESRNHILLADEPAWRVFIDEVRAFLEPERRADQERLRAAEEQFRRSVRSGLQANLPAGWGSTFREPENEAERLAFRLDWERKLHAAGWSGISWPKEYGGRGGTLGSTPHPVHAHLGQGQEPGPGQRRLRRARDQDPGRGRGRGGRGPARRQHRGGSAPAGRAVRRRPVAGQDGQPGRGPVAVPAWFGFGGTAPAGAAFGRGGAGLRGADPAAEGARHRAAGRGFAAFVIPRAGQPARRGVRPRAERVRGGRAGAAIHSCGSRCTRTTHGPTGSTCGGAAAS